MKQNRRSFVKNSVAVSASAISGLISTAGIANAQSTTDDTIDSARTKRNMTGQPSFGTWVTDPQIAASTGYFSCPGPSVISERIPRSTSRNTMPTRYYGGALETKIEDGFTWYRIRVDPNVSVVIVYRETTPGTTN
jgi:hypothetical protein